MAEGFAVPIHAPANWRRPPCWVVCLACQACCGRVCVVTLTETWRGRIMKTLRRHAYTSVDLVCTIVVALLMAAMILPAVAAAREKSVQVRCQENLRQIGRA